MGGAALGEDGGMKETSPLPDPFSNSFHPNPLAQPASLATDRDMSIDELRAEATRAVDWVADYLSGLESQPVIPPVAPGDIRRSLPESAPEHGESMDAIFSDLESRIAPGLTHWNHPSFFAYFNASSSGPGMIAELIAAAINSNSMIWQTCPAAHELEELTAGWLRRWMGLPESFRGLFTDGGSASTFHALAAARQTVTEVDWRQNGGRGAPELRLYVTEHTHSSIHKAMLALGLGLSCIREVACDDRMRMSADGLREAIEADLQAGRRPFAVVATLGTTSVTSVDPVADIAEVCRQFELWLHVDAAHGGAAALLPEQRHLFDGWQHADSIVVNPHKWLMVPLDLSVLYTRHPDVLRDAFSLVPAYLQTTTDLPASEPDSLGNMMDYGLSLGRRFRALKLWFVLRYFGRQGLIDRLRGHLESARWLAQQIDLHPKIERVAPVPLSTVCFRAVPPRDSEDGNAFNRRWLQAIHRTGEIYLSPTELGGRFVLRFVVSGLRTERRHVEAAWSLLCHRLDELYSD